MKCPFASLVVETIGKQKTKQARVETTTTVIDETN
jgi:hypothetical protein